MSLPRQSSNHPNASYGIHAVGLCCALGADVSTCWNAVLEGARPLRQRSDLIPGLTVLVGQMPGSLPELPAALQHYASRNARLLLHALEQIRDEVDCWTRRYGAERIAVVIGSSTSGIDASEEARIALDAQGEFPPGFAYSQQTYGAVSGLVRESLGLRGIHFTVATACSSSAKVFGSARALLRAGLCDAVVVGGADALGRLTLNGFQSLGALAGKTSNSFSVNRDGLNVGEGAALFLLSRDPAAVELAGVGESVDGYHFSAPEPMGSGAEAAMRGALADAGLMPGDISYVNLHGTGTPQNDAMESRAVHRVFGESVPCSSTKPLTGHALGAAGAVEIALCHSLLTATGARRLLPPQLWDGVRDPDLPPLTLVAADQVLPPGGPTYVMSNSFAFGGNNCSVILCQH